MFAPKSWSGSNVIVLALPVQGGDLYKLTTSYLTDITAHRQHLMHLNYELLMEDRECPLAFDPTWQAMIRTMMDVWCVDYESESLTILDRMRDRLSKPALIEDHDVVLELSVGLRDSSGFFSLWCDEGSEIMHALLIGKLVLNSLRELVPTFIYTYAHHTGNGLLMNEKEEIAGWMSGAGPYHYLYTEGVSEGISLDLFAADDSSSVSEFLAVMYQILSGLILAYDRYKFTHNALHLPGTVIVRPIALSSIPLYGLDSNLHYITCSHLAQIRDFRWASAQWGEELLGSHLRTSPFLDVYSLCHTVADTLLQRARLTKRMSDISKSKYTILRDIAGYCVVPEELVIDKDLWQATGLTYWKQPSTTFAHGQELTLLGLMKMLGASQKHLRIPLHVTPTQTIVPAQYIKTVSRFYLRYQCPTLKLSKYHENYRSPMQDVFQPLSIFEHCDASDLDIGEIEARANDIVQSIYHNLSFPIIAPLVLPHFYQDEEYYADQAFALAVFSEKLSYICALERCLIQARQRKDLPLRPMFASIISKLRTHWYKQQSVIEVNAQILREAGVGLRQYDRLLMLQC